MVSSMADEATLELEDVKKDEFQYTPKESTSAAAIPIAGTSTRFNLEVLATGPRSGRSPR